MPCRRWARAFSRKALRGAVSSERGPFRPFEARLVGSLLAAMTEFAMQTTGMPPSYIELSNGERKTARCARDRYSRFETHTVRRSQIKWRSRLFGTTSRASSARCFTTATMGLGSAAWSRARYFRPSSRRDCSQRAPNGLGGRGRAYQPQYQPHLRRGVGVRAQEYSGDLRTASGHNLKDFTAFNARIPEARVPNPLCLRRACGEIARDGKNRSSGIQSVRY